MSSIARLAAVAVAATLAAGAVSGPATAAAKAGGGSHPAKVAKQGRTSARKAPGTRAPVRIVTTTAVAVSAFPAGGKGSGSEATCGLWNDRLQEDVQVLGDAESVDDRVAASNDLQQDKDDALDAGCVVID